MVRLRDSNGVSCFLRIAPIPSSLIFTLPVPFPVNARDRGRFDLKPRLLRELNEHLSSRVDRNLQSGQAVCDNVGDLSYALTTCECVPYSGGVIGISCVDACPHCEDNGASCGYYSYSYNTTETFEVTLDSLYTFTYGETGDYYGNFTIESKGCDESFTCEDYTAYINSTKCNSCTACSQGWGVVVDCENVVVGSSFDMCDDDWWGNIEGFFEGVNYYSGDCEDFAEPPSNDNCTDAVTLQIGATVVGTTYGAHSDTVPSCQLAENDAEGVWYKFQGNGSPILVSTCLDAYNASFSSSTIVSVYQGSNCGQLQCLPVYHQSLSCGGPSYEGSSFSMESASNTTYYIHITDQYEDYSDGFSLSVTEYLQPIHDECSSAGDIMIDGDAIHGTARLVGDEAEESSGSACGSLKSGIDGIAWYTVTPTKNATLRASTCSAGTSAMSTGIAIVSGGCDEQACLAESDPNVYYQGCDQGGAIVDFEVVAGAEYSLVVSGSVLGDLGFFELKVRTLNRPVNDRCEGAVDVGAVGSNVTGTLFDATTSPDEEDFSCSIYSYGEGVWYTFTGTGEVVRASSPSDSVSSISIYEGECGSLKCVAKPRNDYSDGVKSSVVQTVEGVTYYVLVSGNGGNNNNFNSNNGMEADGSFDLSIASVVPPPNAECSAAIDITLNDPEPTYGSTEFALEDGFQSECAGVYIPQSPALWYRVEGTGQQMKVDTCSNTFDSMVSVLEASCDGNSSCIASSDYACGSPLIWETEEGVPYYIRVGSGSGDDTAVRVSTFEAAPNDVCSGAIELVTGVAVNGSMDGASPGNVSIGCSSDTWIPSLWYYIDGDGGAMEISTCDPEGTTTMFSGGIQIFKGSTCSSELACVPTATAYDCSNSYSAVSARFRTEEGERYYILVTGYWSGEEEYNKFTLSASQFEPVDNDVCPGAYSIESSNAVVQGSVADATPDILSCGQNDMYGTSGAGVWYAVEGTGMPMMASTCSGESSMDTTITVFSGQCDDLSCVAYGAYKYDLPCGEDTYGGGSRVIFETEVDTTYYVVVTGSYYQGDGGFSLTISNVDSPPNSDCSNATETLADGVVVTGSTVNATNPVPMSESEMYNSSFATCVYDWNSPGLWYSLVGTGQGLTLTTCTDETTISSAISVFSGGCGSLECLANGYYNDDSSCSQSGGRVTLKGEVGVEYLIFVHGADSYMAGGEIGLKVSSFEFAANDECSGATPVVPDGESISGSLEMASGSEAEPCIYSSGFPTADLWYRVEGTGDKLIASTCGPETSYETLVEVFEAEDGSCSSMACVWTFDDVCFGGQAEWFASAGTTYFIRVSGYSSMQSTEFELTVSTA